MGLMLNRVNELIGDASATTHPDVNNLYSSAISEIINHLPEEELLRHSPEPISLSASLKTWQLPGEVKILGVYRKEENTEPTKEAKEVSKITFDSAGDTNSLYYATKNTPVYNLDNSGDHTSILKVLPDFNGSDTGEIYFFNYPVEKERLHVNNVYQGDFVVSTGWNVAASGVSVASEKLVFASVTDTHEAFFFNKALTPNTTYKLKLTISDYSAGGLKAALGDNGVLGGEMGSNGTFEQELTSGSTVDTKELRLSAVGTTTLKIDNVSLKRAGSTADLATDDEPAHLPELSHHAVALRTALNILIAKISDAVQTDEDAELQGLLSTQIAALQKAYEAELEGISGGHH